MTTADANVRLLIAVAAIVRTARVVGWFATKVGQPRVVGEIVAGILLGPSLLGLVAPDALHYLFPEDVLGGLKSIAQIGLVLFMFLVGLELDVDQLRGQGHRAVAISHASIILPFNLGGLLALWLHPRFGGDSDRLSFALFIGIAMAITAFPVLARVIQEAKLDTTRIGALALTCAAVDDVTAWCGLAVVVAVVNASSPSEAVVTLALSLAFVGGMLMIVRPLLARMGSISLPTAVAFALLCAWLTEQIGIHAIFGAFLAGAVLPRTDAHRRTLVDRLEIVTTTVLLPMFFVVVGLSTKIGLLDTAYLWGVAGAVIVVAVAGKLGGSSVVARLFGESWTDAITLGVLMNTRGLTEIVILTVGLELGVIDDTMFTVMVIMALVTTIMAGPVLKLLGAGVHDSSTDRDASEPAAARTV